MWSRWVVALVSTHRDVKRMNVGNKIILAALRKAYGEIVPTNPVTLQLRAKLLANSADSFSTISGGAIKSVTANSQTTIFMGAGESVDATDLVGIWSYLIELYDRAFTKLGSGQTDVLLEALMETYLRDVTGYTSDWTALQK